MAIPILAIIFGFVILVIKLAMDHEKAKLSLRAGAEKSLTTSELKAMIETAVQEAVAPLERRLEALTAGEEPDEASSSEALGFLEVDEPEEPLNEDAGAGVDRARTQ